MEREREGGMECSSSRYWVKIDPALWGTKYKSLAFQSRAYSKMKKYHHASSSCWSGYSYLETQHLILLYKIVEVESFHPFYHHPSSSSFSLLPNFAFLESKPNTHSPVYYYSVVAVSVWGQELGHSGAD